MAFNVYLLALNIIYEYFNTCVLSGVYYHTDINRINEQSTCHMSWHMTGQLEHRNNSFCFILKLLFPVDFLFPDTNRTNFLRIILKSVRNYKSRIIYFWSPQRLVVFHVILKCKSKPMKEPVSFHTNFRDFIMSALILPKLLFPANKYHFTCCNCCLFQCHVIYFCRHGSKTILNRTDQLSKPKSWACCR